MIERLDQIISDAIAQRIFPGAILLVQRDGHLLHQAAYGSTMYDHPQSIPVRLDLIYDLASLTKVFTATAALILVERGLLELHAPAQRYLPQLRAQEVTLWHLLTHSSGLDLRLSVLRERGRQGSLEAVLNAPLLQPPGRRVAYTNINSLLLGEIVAQVSGLALETAIGQLVLEPLQLQQTGFRPDRGLLARIAPTELDLEWRGGLVHGSVHDESAAVLGGVAGHAGLFSTAADVLRFSACWLAGGLCEASGVRLLSSAMVQLATRNHTAGLELACGLGWMLERDNFMGRHRQGCYGHTGFTGPAIAIDPHRRTIMVLLSNRVYPQRRPPLHHDVTAALWEAIAEAATPDTAIKLKES